MFLASKKNVYIFNLTNRYDLVLFYTALALR